MPKNAWAIVLSLGRQGRGISGDPLEEFLRGESSSSFALPLSGLLAGRGETFGIESEPLPVSGGLRAGESADSFGMIFAGLTSPLDRSLDLGLPPPRITAGSGRVVGLGRG